MTRFKAISLTLSAFFVVAFLSLTGCRTNPQAQKSPSNKANVTTEQNVETEQVVLQVEGFT